MLRRSITLKEFWDGHILMAIHCKTHEDAAKLMIAFDSMGKHWKSGRSYVDYSCWASYGDRMCYNNAGEYCSREFYEDMGIEVFDFKDVRFDTDRQSDTTLDLFQII